MDEREARALAYCSRVQQHRRICRCLRILTAAAVSLAILLALTLGAH